MCAVTGGIVGLVGAIICGPRIGKFDDEGKPRDLAPHDMSLVSIGAFLMWFGWLGFNGGTMYV
jgi:ammonium transporter, Amt family